MAGRTLRSFWDKFKARITLDFPRDRRRIPKPIPIRICFLGLATFLVALLPYMRTSCARSLIPIWDEAGDGDGDADSDGDAFSGVSWHCRYILPGPGPPAPAPLALSDPDVQWFISRTSSDWASLDQRSTTVAAAANQSLHEYANSIKIVLSLVEFHAIPHSDLLINALHHVQDKLEIQARENSRFYSRVRAQLLHHQLQDLSQPEPDPTTITTITTTAIFVVSRLDELAAEIKGLKDDCFQLRLYAAGTEAAGYHTQNLISRGLPAIVEVLVQRYLDLQPEYRGLYWHSRGYNLTAAEALGPKTAFSVLLYGTRTKRAVFEPRNGAMLDFYHRALDQLAYDVEQLRKRLHGFTYA